MTELHADVYGDTLYAELYYPRSDAVQFVEVGLTDVRAADSVRLSYDFARDGWRVEQASVFVWTEGDTTRDPDWQEVAFIPAWGRIAAFLEEAAHE